MELIERKEYEEEETSHDDIGSALITGGCLVLLFGGLPMLFMQNDLQDGVMFFAKWMTVQGAVGVGLIAFGIREKLKAHVKDDA